MNGVPPRKIRVYNTEAIWGLGDKMRRQKQASGSENIPKVARKKSVDREGITVCGWVYLVHKAHSQGVLVKGLPYHGPYLEASVVLGVAEF